MFTASYILRTRTELTVHYNKIIIYVISMLKCYEVMVKTIYTHRYL